MVVIKNILRALLPAAALAISFGAATPAEAARQWADCSVASLLVRTDMMSIRCAAPVGGSVWFNLDSTANVEFYNRIMTLANSALLAGKPIKVLYETTDASRQIIGIDVFR